MLLLVTDELATDPVLLLVDDAPEVRVTVTPEDVLVTPVCPLLTVVSFPPSDFVPAEEEGLPVFVRVSCPDVVRLIPVFLAEVEAVPLDALIPVLLL